MVCRASPSFVRFGSFQLPSTRPDDLPLVQQLADYVIRHHYPHLEGRASARCRGVCAFLLTSLSLAL